MQAIHTYNATGEPSAWPGSGIQYTRSAKDLLHHSPTYPYSYPALINKTRVLIYSGDYDVQARRPEKCCTPTIKIAQILSPKRCKKKSWKKFEKNRDFAPNY